MINFEQSRCTIVQLSKLRKNKNNLYQIYLLKLHKIILKFKRLNFFKEIAIGSKNGPQTTLESPESPSGRLLV